MKTSIRLGCRLPSHYKVVCDGCGKTKKSSTNEFNWDRKKATLYVQRYYPYSEWACKDGIDSIVTKRSENLLAKEELVWVLRLFGWMVRKNNECYCPACKKKIRTVVSPSGYRSKAYPHPLSEKYSKRLNTLLDGS